MLRRFAAAWRFLTVLPLPFAGSGAGDLDHLRRSPALFPAVGLILGCAAWLFGAAVSGLFPQPVAAVLAVALLLAFSGGLHLDGLADSADALLSATHGREKALAIMKDSRIGAHGAMAVSLALLLKFACLASLRYECLPLVLAAVPVAGRAAMLFPMALLPYARERGLGGLFDAAGRMRLPALACLWTGCSLFAVMGARGLAIGGAIWLAATLGWIRLLRVRLNGATGDSYGAACELGETAVCLAAAMLLSDL